MNQLQRADSSGSENEEVSLSALLEINENKSIISRLSQLNDSRLLAWLNVLITLNFFRFHDDYCASVDMLMLLIVGFLGLAF